MDDARAFEIGARCLAVMVDRLALRPIDREPGTLDGITLPDAIEASRIIAAHNRAGGERVKGGALYRAHVSPEILPILFTSQQSARDAIAELLLPPTEDHHDREQE